MVDEELEASVRKFRRRISEIEATANVIRHRAGGNKAVVDFSIGFPFNPLVEDRNRLGAVSKSSVTIAHSESLTDGVIVAVATIRLAPLPADVWGTGTAEALVKDSFPELQGTGMTVHIEPGEVSGKTEEWWPHIEFGGLSGGPGVDRILRWLENSIPKYLSLARERNRKMVEK